ncbi:hypothetical protein HYU50_03725 [Candidatus Woesearchaeota archaeon]|nr:hypothetical protein [Candidatus Woesearchaeota archaeon]
MRSLTAKAFAPGNISCIFVIRKNKNPAKSGSLGLGFTINKGAAVTIKKAINSKERNKKTIKKIKKNKNIIYFNNEKINFPTVNSVIEKLTKEKVIVNIKSELPLGAGFGLSGASALATAYALNKLLKLKKSKKELALIAHIAEVENLTGLGDVINQYYGGFLVKYKPSYMFKAEKLSIKNKLIHYRYFNGLDTKKVISNKKIKNKINKAGISSLNKIKSLNKKDINLKKLIGISKEFSAGSGLLKNNKVKNAIKEIEKNNGNASMIMLGNAVFSDKKFRGSKKLIITDRGAHLL